MSLVDYYASGGGKPAAPRRRASGRPRPSLVAPRSSSTPEAKSLLGQFGDVLAGVPRGLLHLGKGAAVTVAAPARMAVDVANGDASLKDVNRVASLMTGNFANLDAVETALTVRDLATGADTERANMVRKYSPIQAEMIDSAENTAMRLRHPSRYVDAYRDGRIVSEVLEDVGNVALVAGPALKALGGTTRVGATAARVGRGLDFAADAPISIPRAGIRAGGRAVGRAIEGTEFGRKVASLSPAKLLPEGRAIAAEVRAGVRGADRAQSGIARQMRRSAESLGLSLDEQAAAIALHSGEANTVRALVAQSGMPLEQVLDVIQPSKIAEHHLTPEAARIALDVLEGRADEGLAGRVAAGAEQVGRQMSKVTDLELEGVGRQSPLDPRYLDSDDPFLDPDLPDSPDSYGQRWRAPMNQARRVHGDLLARADEAVAAGDDVAAEAFRRQAAAVPLVPADLRRAGVEPQYVPGGVSELVQPKRGARLRSSFENDGSALLGDRKKSSEYQAVGSGESPRSFRTLADKAMRATRDSMTNQTYREVTAGHQRSAAAVLGDEQWGQIQAEARSVAERTYPGAPERAAVDARARAGEMVLNEMADRGLEPWPKSGDIAEMVRSTDIDETTPFLPAGLRESLSPWWNSKPPSAVLKSMEWMNRKFKGAVLPFSLRWQLGDAMSNMMMAGLAGGVDPISMFRGMKAAKALAKSEQGALLLDQAVPETGLFFDEQEWLRQPSAKADRRDLPVLGKARPIKAVQQASFRLNEAINRIERQGFYLEKLQRRLTEGGVSFDEALANIDDPKVERAIARAVEDTAFTLGDMSNMSPFERKYMRQVFPFWPWTRHVMKLASGLAIDHPARMLLTMRIGSLVAEEEELPPFLRGSIKVGDSYFQPSFMNPLGDLEALPLMPWSPESTLRSASPVIKVAAAAGLGMDMNRGGLQLSRPRDTGRYDAYERPTVNPLILDPAALGFVAARQLPFTREAWNQAFGSGARYGTGEFIEDRYGRRLDEDPRAMSIPRLFGVPLPVDGEEVRDIQATVRRRRRARAKKTSD